MLAAKRRHSLARNLILGDHGMTVIVMVAVNAGRCRMTAHMRFARDGRYNDRVITTPEGAVHQHMSGCDKNYDFIHCERNGSSMLPNEFSDDRPIKSRSVCS
jgi:hypothetical protein